MNTEQKLLAAKDGKENKISPVFVEAEEMLDRISDITNRIAQRAHDLFLGRGAEFGSPVGDWSRAEAELLRPTPVKITETKDAINITAQVPGFKADEIEVSIENNVLMLSGETRSEEEKEGENTFYSEWSSSQFFRQLALPTTVETENIQADLKDGVLQMSFKKKAVQEPVKVAVKSA